MFSVMAAREQAVKPGVLVSMGGHDLYEFPLMRAILPALLAGLMLVGSAGPALADRFEAEVLSEINQARANPSRYARELLRTKVSYGERGHDDPAALADAVEFLMRQPRLAALTHNPRLAAAAADHVESQGPRGKVGHGRSGAFGKRLQANGVYAGLAAEAISYGQPTARDVVRQLVVDAGVPNRGHRRDIFGRNYQAAGVACGPHAKWEKMCVIEFAGAIMKD